MLRSEALRPTLVGSAAIGLTEERRTFTFEVDVARMSNEQITRNCHYISRFLTRPWEDSQRQLHFYDFEANAFDVMSSKNLFAEDRLNSPEVETWLRDVLETPLAAIRPRLLRADPAALDDRRFFRAAVLMLWLQGVRTKSIEDEEAKRDLDQMAALPADQLDLLVGQIQTDFEFRLVFTPATPDTYYPLFMPSSGIFDITYPDNGNVGGFHRGIGMPIDVTCALVATGAEIHGAIDSSLFAGSVANCSVGTSASKRVVVPPGAMAADRTADLRDALIELRRANDFLVGSVDRVRHLVERAFATVGIRPARDRAGRIIPGV